MFYILVEIYAMGTEWHIITDTNTSEQMAQYIRDNIEELDDTPYDDGLTDAYVAEYESSLPVSDITSTEVEGFSEGDLFEPLRELLED